ncbi:DeoR/GlpR family DNA-binding transcription regulator, partial [Mitsuokella jalaludinii]
KQRIAQAAVKLIHEKDMVFLDISTSNLAIAELLVKMELEVTVVTNMIDILVVLARNPKIRVVFAGGKINKSRDGFWGGMTLDFISRLKSDIAFVGAVGVDVKENSVSTYDIDDGINKAAIIRHSKKAYVVAEARKLSTDGNYNYTTLDTLSGLITDSEPAADIRAAADSYGVEIILP